MTLLVAFIRPEDLSLVQDALDRSVACLVSATSMVSHGPEPTMTGSFRGNAFRIRRIRLRLEVAVDDEFADAAAKAIAHALPARGGDVFSDGELFVVRAYEAHALGLGG
jgi:nitrogen regulatory protein PII